MTFEIDKLISKSVSALEAQYPIRGADHSGSPAENKWISFKWISFSAGSRSLPASSDPGRLEHQIAEMIRDLRSQAAFQVNPGLHINLGEREFPIFIPDVFAPVPRDVPSDDAEHRAFVSKLDRAFEDTPLENGYSHLAEALLREALLAHRRVALRWIREMILDQKRPSRGASVLRCLGRLEIPGSDKWRTELVRDALAQVDIELRDAAVQAVESWEDEQLVPVLQIHCEEEPWLREYIEQVVRDLSD